ncbi:hypothetical protein Emed_000871 [Eimeria media]
MQPLLLLPQPLEYRRRLRQQHQLRRGEGCRKPSCSTQRRKENQHRQQPDQQQEQQQREQQQQQQVRAAATVTAPLSHQQECTRARLLLPRGPDAAVGPLEAPMKKRENERKNHSPQPSYFARKTTLAYTKSPAATAAAIAPAAAAATAAAATAAAAEVGDAYATRRK